MSLKRNLLLAATIALAALSITIIWQLLTTDYPTHSDIFYTGLTAGLLAGLLLICLFLIALLAHHLMSSSKQQKQA